MKYHRFLLLLILIFVVNILTCCSDNNDKIVSPEESVFSIDKFPMTVGSRWTYSVHDTTRKIFDTITVAIIDTTTLFNEPATIWVDVGRNYKPRIRFFTVVEDTIGIYCDTCTMPIRKLIFPITIGNIWTFYSSHGREWCTVYPDTTMNLEIGEYNASSLFQGWGGPWGDIRTYSTWLVPDIGIVRFEAMAMLGTADSLVDWRLLNYHIPR